MPLSFRDRGTSLFDGHLELDPKRERHSGIITNTTRITSQFLMNLGPRNRCSTHVHYLSKETIYIPGSGLAAGGLKALPTVVCSLRVVSNEYRARY